MAKRDVGPLIQMIRNFLLGRKHTTALRYQQDIVTRSPPPPQLPEGPHHIISANYYYARDARREVVPPLVLAEQGSVPKIAAPTEGAPKLLISKTPGQTYVLDK